MKNRCLVVLFTLLLLSITPIYCPAEQQTELAAIVNAERQGQPDLPANLLMALDDAVEMFDQEREQLLYQGLQAIKD